MVIKTKAGYVERGFGQVEPNHLSGQRTGQVYAQLPAAAAIDVLENGQFVKYDYAKHEVNFTGKGEWMLVFNEVKTYYDYEPACNFAMKKANYNARVFSPVGADTLKKAQARDYSDFAQAGAALDGTNEPFGVAAYKGPEYMPEGTTMVPRVLKTNIGDIMTTNTVTFTSEGENIKPGLQLVPNVTTGILTETTSPEDGDMVWEVAKVYTMPDGQPGVKIVRIA